MKVKFSITIVIIWALSLHFLPPVNVIMVIMCLQTEGQGPPCSGLQHTWARCWIANRVFANISILLIYMGPSLSKYCIGGSFQPERKNFHMSSDWSIAWLTLLSLANTGPCKHFLPFVNRKCHTLAPPPTVTTHHPQTLGNGEMIQSVLSW